MDPRVCILLLLLGTALCSAEVPRDCCLSVAQQRPLPVKLIQSYKVQEAGGGCKISATVLHVRDKRLCLPHPQGHPWVQRLMRIVDQKKRSRW